MADVAVENPANSVITPKKPVPMDNILNIDSLEGPGPEGGDEYATLKRLQRHLEYVCLFSRAFLSKFPTMLIWQQVHSTSGGIYQG